MGILKEIYKFMDVDSSRDIVHNCVGQMSPSHSSTIEKVVSKKLTEHVTNSNLNEQHQSAYRSLHSTETVLLIMLNVVGS